ncbi:NAD(P)-dependent oxidoreductase, partial [Candidatus Parvarchaeota archaeon]|nr:NAD(P)-dependent oxidoreductase [Candidatus Parvarchaeota archaeon]
MTSSMLLFQEEPYYSFILQLFQQISRRVQAMGSDFPGLNYLQKGVIMIREFSQQHEAQLEKMADSGTRVLITGGCGYLGSALTEMLVERGFQVTVVDNLCFSQNALFNLFSSGKLDFIYGDVTNEAFMSKLLKENKFDFIFPLAAVVGFPTSDQKPEVAWLINHAAVMLILKYRNPDSRIIFPTTNSGYGTTTGKVECTEQTPLNPISTYGKSKVAAEKA